jgi:hypothetical protein
MPKLNKTRHDLFHDGQGKMFADLLNDSEQPSDAVLDLFICGDGERPIPDSETHEGIPLTRLVQELEAQPPDFSSSKHPQSTKRSRQAMGVVTGLSMEGHGWKQTGTKSSLWAFERRCAHLRDRAEGRNHGVQDR